MDPVFPSYLAVAAAMALMLSLGITIGFRWAASRARRKHFRYKASLERVFNKVRQQRDIRL